MADLTHNSRSSDEPTMPKLFPSLNDSAQIGSKPRCHLLTRGTREEVARRLTDLIAQHGTVRPNDKWMPNGFVDTLEAQLPRASVLLDESPREQLLEWWLAAGGDKTTPNFDIASTCNIDGSDGLLLVEAKAHEGELTDAAAGKKLILTSRKRELRDEEKLRRRLNHDQIASAIQTACDGFNNSTALTWKISRDSHYQMSNRFAWAWKLTDLGFPVILVYLGFLNADEMRRIGRIPLTTKERWTELVRDQSKGVVPEAVWNHKLNCNGKPLISLVRAIEVPLEAETN